MRWRARYATFIRNARRLFVPSEDMAKRIKVWFPDCQPVVRPYLELYYPKTTPTRRPLASGEARHVVVIGAIGVHKGFNILLDCAKDAQERGLPLCFTVMGYTSNDAAAKDVGIAVTGNYDDAEALQLLADLKADVAFLPSIWPETYCYALSVAVLAGLFPVTFDIGTQAERVRDLTWGLCVPLEISTNAVAINDMLLGQAIASPPQDIVERVVVPGNFKPDYFCGYYDMLPSTLEK